MDFDKLLRDLLAQGEDIDDIAAHFTKALNAASAANKSKKEREKYIADTRAAAVRDIAHDVFSYRVAAKIATVAAAEEYPELPIGKLKEYEDATVVAMEATAGFNSKITSGTDVLEALFDALPSGNKTTVKKPETDEEKIARFLRKLG